MLEGIGPRDVLHKMKYLKYIFIPLLLVAIGYLFEDRLAHLLRKPSEAQLIPREILFSNQQKTAPKISPDGKRVAYLAPYSNVLNIWMKNLEGSPNDRVVTSDSNRGIQTYIWAHDNRHMLYLQDKNENENWRLFAIDLETSKKRDLTPFEKIKVQILAHDKRFPNKILITMNKDNPTLHDAYEVDLISEKVHLIAKNPGNILSWIPDREFFIRGALAKTHHGGVDLLIRKNKLDHWTKVISWNSVDSLISRPVGFSKDGKRIFLMDSRNSNTAHLIELSLETGVTKVLSEDPDYDIATIIIDPKSYEIEAVTYIRGRTEREIFQDSYYEYLVDKQRGDISLLNRDHSAKRWIYILKKDDRAPAYYMLDVSARTHKFLFYQKPGLDNFKLSKMKSISFKTEDGFTIHGYVTYPPDGSRKNLPMVIYVRENPRAQDAWGFHAVPQWLANRGYAVLQVNYRGSLGYGKKFVKAGGKSWHRKMRSDLFDAANWAVNKKIANPNKICIYGSRAVLADNALTNIPFHCTIEITKSKNSNKMKFYQETERYLAKYLGGRFEK